MVLVCYLFFYFYVGALDVGYIKARTLIGDCKDFETLFAKFILFMKKMEEFFCCNYFFIIMIKANYISYYTCRYEIHPSKQLHMQCTHLQLHLGSTRYFFVYFWRITSTQLHVDNAVSA